MASYKTHEFRYNQPKGGPNEANDITIVFNAQVEVVGVDGVAPDDPKADYTLEGDGSANIKISDIEKSNDETIKVRVKGSGRTAPTVKQAFWTDDDGKRIPKALSQLAADSIDADLDPVAVALDTFEPLMLEIKNLSRCVELLTNSATRGTTFGES